VIDRLKKLLLNESYTDIPSNLDNITLYVQEQSSYVIGVQIFDYSELPLITIEQFELMRSRAIEYLAGEDNTPVHLLAIFFTKETEAAMKFVLGDFPCWIVDCNNNSLLLFKNMQDDFYGLRGLMDKVTSSTEDILTIKEDNSDSLIEAGKEAAKTFILRGAPLNLLMFLINIFVYFYMLLTGSPYNLDYMLAHGAMYVPYVVERGEYYRLFTCLFIHFGIQHLIGNMIVLFFLGDNLERAIGQIKYIIIYIFSGLMGSICSFTFSYIYNRNIISGGASGAIFGVIGALLWVVIKNRGKLEDMTTFRVAILICYALYSGIAGKNIDNIAHIGGLLSGFLMALLLYHKKKITKKSKDDFSDL